MDSQTHLRADLLVLLAWMVAGLLLSESVWTPSKAWPEFPSTFLLSPAQSVPVTVAAACIPLLTCQLHQGLITHGEHLTSRCQGWTDDMTH